MSQRKPLAAVAAVTAALALAVPAASASAATTAPPVPTASIGLASGSLTCQLLVYQLRFAELSGNILWANSVARVLQFSGCGGAAI
jgi:hypothetical protein